MGNAQRIPEATPYTPFERGYIGAISQEVQSQIDARSYGLWMRIGPDNFAPETIERIKLDCVENLRGRLRPKPADAENEMDGRWFWEDRQAGRWPLGFPHLTPYLDETDGMVRFRG